MRERTEHKLHIAFEIGIILKGIDGLAELVGGIGLIFISPGAVERLFLFFARQELAEDPQDRILNYGLRLVHDLAAQPQFFYSALFIIHGVVKVFLVAALMKKKMWAYPAAMGAFALFVVYQLYQLSLKPSGLLWLITAIDIAVIALTANEYWWVRRKRLVA